MADLTALTQEALAEVAACGDLAALDAVRVRWLGKKGVLTEQLKSLGALPAAERPAAGARINAAKERVQAAIEAHHVRLERADIERSEIAACGNLSQRLLREGGQVGQEWPALS